ncbi:hypothetical protein EYF80_054491 [Liparis tanakae]|uniref:Uncharacterized protein n=1 Tax=Liparis tanakae TaxID=230148 RepID=A0A4Z2F2A4_9TELE|nr:hypothetical protein EYF80_054491 [Liparis tanakae]
MKLSELGPEGEELLLLKSYRDGNKLILKPHYSEEKEEVILFGLSNRRLFAPGERYRQTDS